jgi:hypothetical protein
MAMEELVLNIGKLIVGFSCMLGPLVFYLRLASAREQRESRLVATILGELNAPDLRGLYAVKIERGIFQPDTAVIDLWNCSKERIWDVMTRLSARLPSNVRCEVNGTDAGPRSTWTLSVKTRHAAGPCCAYCR